MSSMDASYQISVRYDSSADAAYVSLSDEPRARSAKMYACDPIGVGGMINLDFDEDGRLIGVEVLGARNKLSQLLLSSFESTG